MRERKHSRESRVGSTVKRTPASSLLPTLDGTMSGNLYNKLNFMIDSKSSPVLAPSAISAEGSIWHNVFKEHKMLTLVFYEDAPFMKVHKGMQCILMQPFWDQENSCMFMHCQFSAVCTVPIDIQSVVLNFICRNKALGRTIYRIHSRTVVCFENQVKDSNSHFENGKKMLFCRVHSILLGFPHT